MKKLVKNEAKLHDGYCVLALDFLADVWNDRIVAQSSRCNKFLGKNARDTGGVKRGRFFPWGETLQGMTQFVEAYRNPGVEVGPFNMTIIDSKGDYVISTLVVKSLPEDNVFLLRGKPLHAHLEDDPDDH